MSLKVKPEIKDKCVMSENLFYFLFKFITREINLLLKYKSYRQYFCYKK